MEEEKVREIIGVAPKIVSYATGSKLGTNALGTALFRYDPKQSPTNPKKLAKVWVEKDDKYGHKWS